MWRKAQEDSIGQEVSAEILRRIANVRDELNELEALLRAIGTKVHGRIVADLKDRTNDLENEITKEERPRMTQILKSTT